VITENISTSGLQCRYNSQGIYHTFAFHNGVTLTCGCDEDSKMIWVRFSMTGVFEAFIIARSLQHRAQLITDIAMRNNDFCLPEACCT
jgi:hypothetical protein